MCKLAGICLVMGGSLLYGINHAVKLKKRRDNLKSLERILMYIESEIRYRHSIIWEAFYNASIKADKPFSKWLGFLGDTLSNCDKDFYDVWCDSLFLLMDETFLTKEDIEELKNLGQTLGYLDIKAHEEGIRLELDNIHEKISDYNEGLKDRMRISVIAGAVFGILIVVILV